MSLIELRMTFCTPVVVGLDSLEIVSGNVSIDERSFSSDIDRRVGNESVLNVNE
jgi:hypothetical protein